MNRRAVLTTLMLSGWKSGTRASERPFLTMRGRIRRFNNAAGGLYTWTETDFMALDQASVTTSTEWTPKSTFTGPRLADVVAAVGGIGTQLRISALDDYTNTMPMSDLAKYGVILAHSIDGKRMTPKDFGPLMVVYPRDDFRKALSTPQALAKFNWQVDRITVE